MWVRLIWKKKSNNIQDGLRRFQNRLHLPDFIKLIAIGRIGRFSAVVTGVQAAEQSVWFQQVSARRKKIEFHLRVFLYELDKRHRNKRTDRRLGGDPPCADGHADVGGGGHLGLHRHDVQVHQVVEEEVQDAVICGGVIDGA